ncbi:MAG: SDR family oxidoreductase [Saprospiraceae bacterium]|nr:SDR family oxidoreductase [Saprospiraceae bacterium]MBK6564540.1 SDR family oxidoreductase [Saprospiraceae bacterium]MBK8079274.1 SDR family oxidoreductase [Saprospiraceae bacterium]MBK8371829.1 SDR family oxidoreductase [Saprospiraceae bacterium]MBK8547094.1 SDR family oxidoreductase [Saprospiraceae bacterium]
MNENFDEQRLSLNGKTALITGASKGIGLAIAKAYLSLGANVVISSRNENELIKVTKEVGSQKFIYKKCHVGNREERESLVQFVLEHFGRIDILVNNAAINPVFLPIADCEENTFDKIMEINVKAPFVLSNLVVNHMKEQGGGSIIHISSVEGKNPSEGLGLYSVSKAALLMLAKSQAKEWGKYNVRVNTILPGLIKTKFSETIWQNEEFLKKWTSKLPLKRMAEPEEIAGLAVFLASDAASYCTGGEYIADGGYLL